MSGNNSGKMEEYVLRRWQQNSSDLIMDHMHTKHLPVPPGFSEVDKNSGNCRPNYRIFRFGKEKAGKELRFSVTYITQFRGRFVSLHIILRKFLHIRGDLKFELGKLSLSWEKRN